MYPSSILSSTRPYRVSGETGVRVADFPDNENYTNLFKAYRDLLYASGYETVKNWPWSYGCFNNGVPIPDIGREIYRESAELQRRYPNPFSTSGGDNYFAWLNSDVQLQTEKPLVTQLWYQVYKARKDLQEAFHDISGADREAFTGWIAKYGSKEYQIDTAWNVKCRAS